MRPQQLVTLVALCGTVALVGSGTPRFGFDSPAIETTATQITDPDATRSVISLSAEIRPLDASPATAMDSLGQAATSDPDSTEPAVISAGAPAASVSAESSPLDTLLAAAPGSPGESVAPDPDMTEPAVALANAPAAETPAVEAPLPDSRPTLPPEKPVQLASASPSDGLNESPLPAAPAPLPPEKPVRLVPAFPSSTVNDSPLPPVRPLETSKECIVEDVCIDDYLWLRYERTPKVDTNKVTEKIKKTVKKKGKTRTVTATIVKYVVADFTWKDPDAAQKADMPLKDYVIGGMDRGFKRKLYHALRVMEEAGFMPGITSAFRDDYRQAIASGNKASSDSSYHGGSRRGGYGHGLAVDLVSVEGNTRLERYAESDELWKWIDANENKLGVGRPYRDRDPPHIGPIDGREFSVKRAFANVKAALQKERTQTAKSQAKKPAAAARATPGTPKRASPEKPSKVSSVQSRAAVQH
jgi:hypothetical protein